MLCLRITGRTHTHGLARSRSPAATLHLFSTRVDPLPPNRLATSQVSLEFGKSPVSRQMACVAHVAPTAHPPSICLPPRPLARRPPAAHLPQVALVNEFVGAVRGGKPLVKQMLMGGGKTTVRGHPAASPHAAADTQWVHAHTAPHSPPLLALMPTLAPSYPSPLFLNPSPPTPPPYPLPLARWWARCSRCCWPTPRRWWCSRCRRTCSSSRRPRCAPPSRLSCASVSLRCGSALTS